MCTMPKKTQMSVPLTETPFVEPLPRNGPYTSYYEGSEQIHLTGLYVDGLKQGTWREFWPGGALKQEVEWNWGMKHGRQQEWSEEGGRVCDGQNEANKPCGTWTWWHANGTHHATLSFDETGKRHGAASWDHEDGTPSIRGHFHHDLRDGLWEWHRQPEHERMLCGYVRGAKHGEDAAWYPGGQLAYRRVWHKGDQQGLEETYYRDGSPMFKGEFHYGQPLGQHTSWDEQGKSSVISYRFGMAEGSVDPTKLQRAVVKLKKDTDASYANLEALEAVVGRRNRGRLLYQLWKEGTYDVANDHEMWEVLGDAHGLFSGGDVIAFLQQVNLNNIKYGSHLPYWPNSIDQLVMRVYQRDPGPIDDGWRDLPKRIRKGVAFVLARFNKDIGDTLKGELAAVAEKHVRSSAEECYWPVEDYVEKLQLYKDREMTPGPRFDEFLAIFGDRAEWIEHKHRAVMENPEDSSLSKSREVIEVATVEEMKVLCSRTCDFSDKQVIKAIREWRGDAGETMVELALGVEDWRRLPVICCAIIKLREEGKRVPQEILDQFKLDDQNPSADNRFYGRVCEELKDNLHFINIVTTNLRRLLADPKYASWHVCCMPKTAAALPYSSLGLPRTAMIRQALQVLPKPQLRGVIERHIAENNSSVCQYLCLLEDPALWQRALVIAENETRSHFPRYIWAFGELGMKFIPALVQARRRAKTPEARIGWSQAIVCGLARAIVDGEEFPEEYDAIYIRFDIVGETPLLPFLERLVYLLPTRRAERILLRALDTESGYWNALRAVASHPTRAVVEKAFSRLLELESKMDYWQGQKLTFAIRNLPNPRDWVRWILANGGGSTCKEALRDAVGEQVVEQIEQDLAKAGKKLAKELDDIDRIVELARQAGNQGEKLYLLRRLEAPTGDLNIIGGPAPGVGLDRWPMFDGEAMTHLFTLDLQTMPELAQGRARAISVFCYRPSLHEAFAPGNRWTAIVYTTDKQLDGGGEIPEDIEPEPEAWFEPVAVHVQTYKEEVKELIYGVDARVLGRPIWLQEKGYSGKFLLQFSESFVDINLGDLGMMYVFRDTAFMQCH